MANTYTALFYHIVFSTKNRAEFIKPEIEERGWSYIGGIARKHYCTAIQIGGIENHIHIAISVPPNLLISDWIGKLKGGSSFHINKLGDNKSLQWQRGYGIVSFGTKDLKWVVNYVLNQKEHHSKGSIHTRLEKTDAD